MFFPVNQDRRPDRAPYITWVLIGLNSLIWISLALMGKNSLAIYEYGFRPGEWTLETLFASMFLHSGIFHVGGNMWFLWMFGPKLEERLGHFLFLPAYLLCGVGAACMHAVFSHGSMVPMVGASGAISGVAGMYFVLLPRSPFRLWLFLGWWFRKGFDVMTRGAVGAWIGEQFVLGLLAGFGARSGVAFWAHVGGFLTGFAIAGALFLKADAAEREVILRPTQLTADERFEISADTVEKPSDLTTLRLS